MSRPPGAISADGGEAMAVCRCADCRSKRTDPGPLTPERIERRRRRWVRETRARSAARKVEVTP